MRNNLVTIVIANFNGEKYLEDCLNSVLKSSYKGFEVLLIDDGSTDKSIKIIKKFQKKDRRIRLLKNKKNLGAAASRNKAIKKVKGEIVVFLDNDTEVSKNWLGELIKPLLREEDIGGAQALLLDFENRDLIQMAGGLLIPHTGWLVPFHQWESYKKTKNILKEREIVAISAALAVKRKVLEKIGGFDELEAVVTEDLDLCWRIWIAGYRIVLAPKAIVYHWTKSVEQRAHMRVNYQKIYFHLAKNSFRSIIKNYELGNVIKYLPLSIAINLARGLFFVFTRGSLSALVGTVQGVLWNIILISDTLREREKLQNMRNFTNNHLSKRMMVQDPLFSIYRKYYLHHI